MARNIQPASTRKRGDFRAFSGALLGAIVWLGLALFFPFERVLPAAIPELAPFAQWLPLVCYALAIWSFVQAVRNLRLLIGSGRMAQMQRPARQAAGKPAKGLPVIDRRPTVQRMR